MCIRRKYHTFFGNLSTHYAELKTKTIAVEKVYTFLGAFCTREAPLCDTAVVSARTARSLNVIFTVFGT